MPPTDYPQKFGKYILLDRIAVGGMAEIFLARVDGAEGFQREVVIKRILQQYNDDPSFVRMFVDEARLTAKLTHANIVQVFDFDVVDGRYYIAMEYIEGQDLKQSLKELAKLGASFSVSQAVFMMLELAKGLAYAHAKEEKGQPLNIVHRDVTPGNVMLSFQGQVKLMDFGIAKAVERSTKTKIGGIKGKIAYMAPEQAESGQVDGRTDMFALGVIIWEVLTSQPLFRGESNYETIVNVLAREPEAPSLFNPSVPKELDAIILRCLAKDPAARYASMSELTQELSRLFYGQLAASDDGALAPLMGYLFQGKRDGSYVPTRSSQNLGAIRRPSTGSMPAVTEILPSPGEPSLPVVEVAAAKPESGSNAWRVLFLALLFLLVAGAAFAAWHFLGEGTEEKAGKVASGERLRSHVIDLEIEPPDAEVFLGNEPQEARQIELGEEDGLELVVSKAGYRTYRKKLDRSLGHKLHIVLEAQAQKASIRILAPLPTDSIWVDDRKLGEGEATLEGQEGQRVMLRIEPKDGRGQMMQSAVIDSAVPRLELRADVEVKISLQPEDLELSSNLGTLSPSGKGRYSLRGVMTGDEVLFSVKGASGLAFEKRLLLDKRVMELELSAPQEAHGEKPSLPANAAAVGAKGEGAKNLEASSGGTEKGPGTEAQASGESASEGDNEVQGKALFEPQKLKDDSEDEEGKTPQEAPKKPVAASSPSGKESDLPANPYETKPAAAPQGKAEPEKAAPSPKKETTPPVKAASQKPAESKPKPSESVPSKSGGGIAIDARPRASVLVNGKIYGRTPKVLKDLEPGPYTVVLTYGIHKITKQLTVKNGKQESIFIDFTEL